MHHDLGKRSLVLAASMIAAILLTSGCIMVGPDFKKPEADVAEKWIDGADPAVKTESVEYREWWKNFNDPALDTLIQKAYAQNLTLQIAGLRVHEARAILGLAAGSLYPQVQRARGAADTVEISRNAEPISNLPPQVGSLVDNSFETYSLGLDAAWELDF